MTKQIEKENVPSKCYCKFVVKFDSILFCMNFIEGQNRPQKLS